MCVCFVGFVFVCFVECGVRNVLVCNSCSKVDCSAWYVVLALIVCVCLGHAKKQVTNAKQMIYLQKD